MQVTSQRSAPVYIDLFAGCGGLSLGLSNAGWRGLFAIEKNPMAFSTLKHNLIDKENHFDWPDWLPKKEHNINEVLNKFESELSNLGRVDLVVGGPPCQGFSLAGRRNKNDIRNTLPQSYIKFVKIVKPSMVFFENVIGFTIGFKHKKSRGKAFSEYVESELRALGYTVKSGIIDFSAYGIPQRRKRFILIGMLNGNPTQFFQKIVEMKKDFLTRKGLTESTSLYEAISDLEKTHGQRFSSDCPAFMEGVYGEITSPYQQLMRVQRSGLLPDSHRFARHNKKTVDRWIQVLANCPRDVVLSEEWKKTFNLKKKSITPLDCKSTCPTLTTLPDDYIHYSEPRILTVREYARIQSFPDWYEFRGKYTTGGRQRKLEVPRYTQVGNAVPPLFAELSGEILEKMLS
ncbi:MAG: DNA cytosine methyltransferase [Candidatus Bathyarchaeota archaeon]|nr:DNA cytosine methyltransferase [Candidatus Bathyarchaeota archaeon]